MNTNGHEKKCLADVALMLMVLSRHDIMNC